MPKAAPEDHRPARAVLHAPYPLPFIITRPPLTASSSAPAIAHSPTTSLPVLPSTSTNIKIPSGPASESSFPIVQEQNDHKNSKPPISSLPYPLIPREDRRRRLKKLQILKLQKDRGEESSEWEIQSYISDKLDKSQKDMLGLTKQVGKISADGELDEDDPNQDENNLLIYAFMSSYDKDDLELSPSDPPEPITPTQAHFPSHEAVQEEPYHSSRDQEEQHELTDNDEYHEQLDRQPTPIPDYGNYDKPTKSEGPAWDVVSDAVSSFWSDGTDADEADQESGIRGSSLTPKLVTPSTSASRLLRKLKKRPHSPERPLFLGQTNQVPFTFIPPPKKAPSQSSFGGSTRHFVEGGLGGYVSEATSVRTIRQIPRSKVNRMRIKKEKEKENKVKKERSVTPRQTDYQRSEIHQQPQVPVTGIPFNINNGFNFGLQNPTPQIPFLNPATGNSIPQQSMFGLDSFLFAPIAPLLRTSEVLSSPTSGGALAPTIPPSHPHGNRESSWSPQPMSVDPRTTESQLLNGGVSWPHALPDRENITPSNSSSFLNHHEGEITSDGDVPMPTALSRITQHPQTLSQAQKKVSRKDFTKRDDVVPLGKACHNYLYLRKMMAAKKRKENGGIGKHKRLKEMINEDRNERLGNSNANPGNTPTIIQQPTHIPPATPPSMFPQPQPQQQQFTPLSPWNFNMNTDPNIQAQAQQLFTNMMMQFAQQQASQGQYQNQVQSQGQPPVPYNIGMPLGFYPQYNQTSPFNPSSWGFNLPQQNNQPSFDQSSQQAAPNLQSNQSMPHQATQAPFFSGHNLAPPVIPQYHNTNFRFPTPGPSPQAPTPLPSHNYNNGFVGAFTPKSPGKTQDSEFKPLKKRLRSISPSSAHDLLLRRTKSPTIKPHVNGLGIGGLLSPAVINSPKQWKKNINAINDEVKIENKEEEQKEWSKLIFDIGLGLGKGMRTKKEDEDDELINRFERRNQWVKEERLRVGSMGLRGGIDERGKGLGKRDKGKGKEVLR